MPPTLILTPRFTEDAQALWQAAVRLGWKVERLASWRLPEHLKQTDVPVVYLEGLFGPMLAEELGIRLTEPPIDWLPRLPEEFRKRWIHRSTLGQARLRTEPAFIKPPNDKSFPARVYAGTELPNEYPDDLPVLISEVVTWEKEFRCFVLDRKVHAFSIYLRHGELQRSSDFACSESEETEAIEFANQVLNDPRVELSQAAVVDVGVIAGRGWAVVEQNAAWGSGIYGCDPKRVLEVIQCASVKSEA